MESADRRNKEARERLEREIKEMRERDERLDRDRQKRPDSISNSSSSFSEGGKENMSKSELDQIRSQSKSDMHSGTPTAAQGYGSQHPERMGSSKGSTINGSSSQGSRMTMSNDNESNMGSRSREQRNESSSSSWPKDSSQSSSIRESRSSSINNSGESWDVERYDTGWGVSNSSESSGRNVQNNYGDVDGGSNRSIPSDQGGYEDRQRNSFDRPNGEDVWNRRESELGRSEDFSGSRNLQNKNNAGENRETDRGRREPGKSREERIDNDELRKLRNSRAEREDRDREW